MPERIISETPIERVRQVPELEDVPAKETLSKEQLYAERRKLWEVTTKQKETEHLARIAEDREVDLERGLPLPGHRKGRRARLVWPDTAAFDRWQAKFEGLPKIDNWTIVIGEGAHEYPGDERIPASGRRYTEIPVTNAEQDWLTMHGVALCNPGTFEPLTLDESI